MNKKKIVLIILLIILLGILVVLTVNVLRKHIIIKELQAKLEFYTSSNNYHIETIREENDLITTYNYNKKDNKIAYFIEKNEGGIRNKVSIYDNGEYANYYMEYNGSKTLEHANSLPNGGIVNHLKYENDKTFQYLITILETNIKSTEINGKSCYLIKDYIKDAELYIEKDTGLCIQYIESGLKVQYKYEFNNVDDLIFIEPDIRQYKIKEKE